MAEYGGRLFSRSLDLKASPRERQNQSILMIPCYNADGESSEAEGASHEARGPATDGTKGSERLMHGIVVISVTLAARKKAMRSNKLPGTAVIK